MKWYFAVSQSSLDRHGHGWRGLIRCAVKSAREHTSLIPHMIYDGAEDEFVAELRSLGVQAVQHRVSFFDHLVRRAKGDPDYLAICSGSFLRTEVPIIETNDEFVLYTDCDVLFMGEVNLSALRPQTFCVAPQFDQTDYVSDANTGVMVMNIPQMRADLPQFKEFILQHLDDGWPGCDQENYRRFYAGNWSPLPTEYNWKPYWGLNNSCKILHWHGPKPQTIRDLIAGRRANMADDFLVLYDRNPTGYKYFYSRWLGVAQGNSPTIVGHIDHLSRSLLAGWALNGDQMDSSTKLNVFVEGVYYDTIDCSGYRDDLYVLYGSKYGAFAIDIALISVGLKITFQDLFGRPIDLKLGDVISHVKVPG